MAGTGKDFATGKRISKCAGGIPLGQKRVCVIGVDPGNTGAVAVYDPWAGKLHEVADMPVDIIQITKRNKKTKINAIKFAGLMNRIRREYGISMIAMEKVHSSPQMGVTSAFSFGYGYGLIYGILETMFTEPLLSVDPQSWKRRVFAGIRNSDHSAMGREKADSCVQARLLFGDIDYFKFAKHHGRADAALIAWYAAKTYQPEKPLDPLS